MPQIYLLPQLTQAGDRLSQVDPSAFCHSFSTTCIEPKKRAFDTENVSRKATSGDRPLFVDVRDHMTGVTLEDSRNGPVMSIKAQPGARRNGICGVHDGALKVAVTQAPENGKANVAIVKVLAEALNIGKNQIELLTGQTSGHKRFLFSGMTRDELLLKLSAALSESNSKGRN